MDTIFYKTTWFLILVTLCAASVAYSFYTYRRKRRKQLYALEAKANALEKEKTLALYESLKQQLNPHFLFNSLSSLGGLIQRDQQKAYDFLTRLSKIYRYILQSGQKETVRVGEDLRLAEIYIQLQQTRFGKGLQFVVQLSDEDLMCCIAPVTIQNLIENAIKHNIIDAESPLIITVSAIDDYLVVSNNFQKKSYVEGSNRQGLQNMRNLYHYLTGKQIIIEETRDIFTIKVPFT